VGITKIFTKQPKSKQKSRNQALKLYLPKKKKWIFYCLRTEKMPELQAFLPHWRWAVTHRPRRRRPPQTVASPPHASSFKLSVSLHLSRSLFLSLSVSLSLISLSLGWDEKKTRTKKKKKRAGEKGRRKKRV
jgi:hypothetical protein